MEAGHHRPRSTRWVKVRVSGPRWSPAGPTQPPIGLTCAWMLACPGDMLRTAGRLASLRTSRDTTEAGPRRIPPLVACGGRAASAETQCPSLSSETTAAVESGANAQFFHQPLTVSMACVPRHVYSPTVDAWRRDRSSTGAQVHDHAAFSPRPPRGSGNTLTATARQRARARR